MFRSNKTLLAGAAGLLMLSLGVHAQVGDAKKDAATLSDQARAQRDANKVLNFIRFHAVRPVALAAAKPAAKAEAEKEATPGARAQAPEAAASAVSLAQAEALLRESPPAAGASAAAVPDQGLPAPDPLPQAAPQSAAIAEPAEPEVKPEEQALQLITHVEPQIPAQYQGQVRSGRVTVPLCGRATGPGRQGRGQAGRPAALGAGGGAGGGAMALCTADQRA